MKHGAEILDTDTCWDLLAEAEIGRVVFTDDDDIEVFPVNFSIGGRSILFRSAPGLKLELVAGQPRVAFEFDDEIEHSGVLGLVSWTPDEKFNYVRITPDRVSGRRFRR
jgi:nitroimidazol reductase NimA-like FMN-containing flavoprotein (pyridoxamine 5'-phosphate oxidase superfamily)